MKHVLTVFNDDRKLISLNGYAFIDENNKCFIIVYGESKRDLLSKYLNELNNK
jgi:hypothetical protein